MVVLIPHSTQELLFTRIQKALISSINDDSTIWYRNIPLWIELPGLSFQTKQELKTFSKTIETVEIGDMRISPANDQIFLPITVKTKNGSINTTLPLVKQLRMKNEELRIKENTFFNLPHSLNIFRLGIVTESENSQFSILNSPLSSHNSRTTIQCSQACTYVLQDSVWFKKSK